MILAAGRGTRLAALSLDRPKVLVDVGGEPLLARQLRYLAEEGIGKVVVNTHHLAEQVEDFCRGFDAGLEIELIREARLLGTAGACASPALLPRSAFVVLYGDVVVDEPIRTLFEPIVAAARRDARCLRDERNQGKGTVEVSAEGIVSRFVERPADARRPSSMRLVRAGPEIVAELPLAAWSSLRARSLSVCPFARGAPDPM